MSLQRGREPKPAEKTHSARVKHKLKLRLQLVNPPLGMEEISQTNDLGPHAIQPQLTWAARDMLFVSRHFFSRNNGDGLVKPLINHWFPLNKALLNPDFRAGYVGGGVGWPAMKTGLPKPLDSQTARHQAKKCLETPENHRSYSEKVSISAALRFSLAL